MEKDKCYSLGYITKTYGSKGELVFSLDVDNPSDYSKLSSVLLSLTPNSELIPYFIEKISIKTNEALVKLEDITTLEMAEPLVGSYLYLPLTQLPALPPDKFYFHELKGYSVLDEYIGKLGIIKDVFEMPQQKLVQMIYKNKEVLFPLHKETYRWINKTTKELHVSLPDGLLDIYLNEKGEEK